MIVSKKILIGMLFIMVASSAISDELIEQETIVFSLATQLESYNGRLLTEIYTSAFNKLGYKFRFKSLPPIRGVIEANYGNIDGCSGRLDVELHEIIIKHPNLVFGNEVLFQFTFSAFVLGEDKVSWDSLLTGDYLISYIRGLEIIEQRFMDINDKSRILKTNTVETIFNLLVEEKIKVAILADDTGLLASKLPEFQGYDIRNSGDLITTGLYPVMNKRHKNLILELSNELSNMKLSGEFENIINSVNKEFE